LSSPIFRSNLVSLSPAVSEIAIEKSTFQSQIVAPPGGISKNAAIRRHVRTSFDLYHEPLTARRYLANGPRYRGRFSPLTHHYVTIGRSRGPNRLHRSRLKHTPPQLACSESSCCVRGAWKVRSATEVLTRQTGRRSDVKWPRYGRFPCYRSLVKNRLIRHRTRFRADIDRFGSLNGRKRPIPYYRQPKIINRSAKSFPIDCTWSDIDRTSNS
jgi:hypothetical protein